MTDTLSAFLLHVPVPGVADPDKRVTWVWCRRQSGAPMSPEHRAIIAEARAGLPESILRHAPWMAQDLAEERDDVPAWPSVTLGPDPFAENEAGRRLLDADTGAVVRELLRVHRTDTPNRWHYLAAAAALRREKADVTPEARNTLAEALRAECCRLRVAKADGLNELNALATEAIERVLGEPLDGTRAKVREDRLYWWAEPADVGYELRFFRALAQELHRRATREAEERAKRQARNPAPGIASESLTVLVKTARFGASASKMQGQILSDKWSVLDEKGRQVATFTPRLSTVESMKIMHALSNLQVARIMRWAVWGGYRKRFEDEQPDFNRLYVERGLSGLAEALGLAPHGETRKELRLALDALSDLRIETPKGEGRVLAWFEMKARGQRAAVLDVSLHGPLAADYLDDDIPRGPERMLVPIPLPQHLPALVGRANEHATQASLQLLIMRHFRVFADVLARDGSVKLSEPEMRRLMDESGTPGRLFKDVLKAYETGEGAVPGPPMLVQTEPGRFDLHTGAFSRERASILAAAHARKKGRESRKGKTNGEK